MQAVPIFLAEVPVAEGLRVMFVGLSGVFLALSLVAVSIGRLGKVVKVLDAHKHLNEQTPKQ